MAYRYGNRGQKALFPQSIDEYVAKDDPVRAYDVFVQALDFGELGIEINPCEVGNSEYDPKAMLKLIVYGYSYGVKSSRKLEKATYHNISFIWLMGGLKPDHKTIAEFMRKNKKAIKKVLKQCARMCIRLDLIGGNVLFADGTKIRANASSSRTHDKAWYEEKFKNMDQQIEQLLQECEAADEQEEHLSSFVAMNKELAKAESLKKRIVKRSIKLIRIVQICAAFKASMQAITCKVWLTIKTDLSCTQKPSTIQVTSTSLPGR